MSSRKMPPEVVESRHAKRFFAADSCNLARARSVKSYRAMIVDRNLQKDCGNSGSMIIPIEIITLKPVIKFITFIPITSHQRILNKHPKSPIKTLSFPL
jgi:hypothetical protein